MKILAIEILAISYLTQYMSSGRLVSSSKLIHLESMILKAVGKRGKTLFRHAKACQSELRLLGSIYVAKTGGVAEGCSFEI